MSNKQLTSLQIADRIQYWYSKWFNSDIDGEKKVYENLYKSYEKLENYYKEHNLI